MQFKSTETTMEQAKEGTNTSSSQTNLQITIQPEQTSNQDAEKTPDAAPQPPTVDYPGGISLIIAFLGLFLAALCVGLDRTIVATAIPKITSDFNSLDDVGWYGSAYLLTNCCFQLFFGKLYAEFHIKWVFLSALLIFEVGSVILSRCLPLHKRPKYTGAMGGSVGIAQITSPTLGGVFTDKVTWRWCFWINLPLGAVTFLTVLFLVKIPSDPSRKSKGTLKGFLDRFDLIGTLVLIPWVICLLLALQWGGSEYTWNSWRIILLLVFFAVLFVLWLFIQYKEGNKATLPLRIVQQRSHGFWVPSLIIMGIGIGIGAQQPLMAVQTVFKGPDIALSTSALIFTQTLAGTIFLSVAENIFQNQLVSQLQKQVPEINPRDIINIGASTYNNAIRHVFLLSVIFACLNAIPDALMEWVSPVKRGQPSAKAEAANKKPGENAQGANLNTAVEADKSAASIYTLWKRR
ncbi:hypothetical protein ACHAQJ_003741 [Trichoderma viride]